MRVTKEIWRRLPALPSLGWEASEGRHHNPGSVEANLSQMGDIYCPNVPIAFIEMSTNVVAVTIH